MKHERYFPQCRGGCRRWGEMWINQGVRGHRSIRVFSAMLTIVSRFLLFFFFLIKKNYLSNLYIQHGAQIHNAGVKGHMFFCLNQPSAPQGSLYSHFFSMSVFHLAKKNSPNIESYRKWNVWVFFSHGLSVIFHESKKMKKKNHSHLHQWWALQLLE